MIDTGHLTLFLVLVLFKFIQLEGCALVVVVVFPQYVSNGFMIVSANECI